MLLRLYLWCYPVAHRDDQHPPLIRDRNHRDFAPTGPERLHSAAPPTSPLIPRAQAVLSKRLVLESPRPQPLRRHHERHPLPILASFFKASMSLTTMRRSSNSRAPSPLSLENALVTATRLQPMMEASCS